MFRPSKETQVKSGLGPGEVSGQVSVLPATLSSEPSPRSRRPARLGSASACPADGGEMSKAEVLRALVKQRLNAAAEEIFALFERTMEEYEQEIRLHRSRQPDGHAAESRGGPHGGLPETDRTANTIDVVVIVIVFITIVVVVINNDNNE